MNDPRLDADTAERMLRGEPTGPPGLAELLAAASSGRTAPDPNGEEAAVAAFRETRPAPRPRRRTASTGLKAALIGLALVLVGGVAVAATTRHLPGPLGNRHPHRTGTPATSQTIETRTTPRESSRPGPDRPDGPPGKPPTHPAPSAHPQEIPHKKEHPHPAKKPKGKAPRNNAPENDKGPPDPVGP